MWVRREALLHDVIRLVDRIVVRQEPAHRGEEGGLAGAVSSRDPDAHSRLRRPDLSTIAIAGPQRPR
jgi:hypothetical protein